MSLISTRKSTMKKSNKDLKWTDIMNEKLMSLVFTRHAYKRTAGKVALNISDKFLIIKDTLLKDRDFVLKDRDFAWFSFRNCCLEPKKIRLGVKNFPFSSFGRNIYP